MVDVHLLADDLRSGRTPYVLATVVRAERPTSAKPGDRALLLPDGTIQGFIGGTCAEATVRTHGLHLLKTGESTLLRITPTAGAETRTEGMVTVGNPCLSGGSLDIFLEAMMPPMLVHVYGEAPVARALLDLGRALGHDVHQITEPGDLPPDLAAVIVAAHGRDEGPILAAALQAAVPYIGLVASRKRGAAVLAALDLPGELRARVRTPAGLDIGARSAHEIALSIYAELIAERPRLGRAEAQPAPEEALDPVCGMAVAVNDAALSLADGDRTVYFCGPGCRQAFADEPARYRS